MEKLLWPVRYRDSKQRVGDPKIQVSGSPYHSESMVNRKVLCLEIQLIESLLIYQQPVDRARGPLGASEVPRGALFGKRGATADHQAKALLGSAGRCRRVPRSELPNLPRPYQALSRKARPRWVIKEKLLLHLSTQRAVITLAKFRR